MITDGEITIRNPRRQETEIFPRFSFGLYSILILLLSSWLPYNFSPIFVPPAFAQSGGRAEFRVDEFKTDQSVKVLKANGKTVTEVLKTEIEKSLKESGFEINLTASLSVYGTIRELEIEDLRSNNAGQVVQRKVRILLDFGVLDESAAREVVRKINHKQEMEYYTEVYSVELGLTQKELMEEKFLPAVAKEIVAYIQKNASKFPKVAAAAAPGKKVTLSDKERAEMKQIGSRKLVSYVLAFENERIDVPKGVPTAAGANKRQTNRFSNTNTIKLEPMQLGDDEIKGVAIVKQFPDDKRNVTVQQGLVEYKMGLDNQLKAGTVNATISKYSFSQTVKGMTLEHKQEAFGVGNTFLVMGGRDFKSSGIGDLPRYTHGASWKMAFGDAADANFIYSATRDANVTTSGPTRSDVDNRMYGVFGKIDFPTSTKFTYDVERSMQKDDASRDTAPYARGSVHEFKLTQGIKSLNLSGEYYQGDQNFKTVYGSATSDRKRVGYTADFPGKLGFVDYALNYGGTRSNKLTQRSLVDVLKNAGLKLTVKPFGESGRDFLKNLAFTNEEAKTHSFDDVDNGTTRTKDNDNFKYALGMKSAIGDYNLGADFNETHDRDNLSTTFLKTRETKYEQGLTHAFQEVIKTDFKWTIRNKKTGAQTDRFNTFGATISRDFKPLVAQFDYLYDIKRGTAASQNSTKNRFTLDLSMSKDLGQYKMSMSLKSDLEVNRFADPTTNHHKLTTTAGIKISY